MMTFGLEQEDGGLITPITLGKGISTETPWLDDVFSLTTNFGSGAYAQFIIRYTPHILAAF